MGAAEVLAAGGILRAGEVVELAAAAKLELAIAAAALQKESGGGRNVFGSDGVDTGGAYTKGAVVTRDSYASYRRWRGDGPTPARTRTQGVGPLQLTYWSFQDQADARGGCWDWRVNCSVGFEILAGYVRSTGSVRDAGSIYNGGRAYAAYGTPPPRHPAQVYGDDLLAKTQAWRARLGTTAPTPAPREDDDMTPDQARMLQVVYDQITGNNFKGWPTWAGGTEEALSLVDFGRRANVETRELHRNLNNGVHPKLDETRTLAAEARDHAYTARTEIAELQADVRAALAATPGVPSEGGSVDLDALADRIVDRFIARFR